jgi:chromosomal replication initiation ATPase DnaA
MKKEIFYRYVERVCRTFGVTKEMLFTKTKKRKIVDARQMLYLLCRNRKMRVTDIQEYMGHNGYKINHSTIIHGANLMQNKAESDRDYKKTLIILQ